MTLWGGVGDSLSGLDLSCPTEDSTASDQIYKMMTQNQDAHTSICNLGETPLTLRTLGCTLKGAPFPRSLYHP